MRLISFLFNLFDTTTSSQSRYLRAGKVGKIILFLINLALTAVAVLLGYLTFVIYGNALNNDGLGSILLIVLAVIVGLCAVVMALKLAVIFISTAFVAFSSKARIKAEERIKAREEKRARKEEKKKQKALKNSEESTTADAEQSAETSQADQETKINEEVKASRKLDIAMGVLHLLLLAGLVVGIVLLAMNIKI